MNATLLFPRWIVPVEPLGQVLEDHALLIENDRIAALLPAPIARERYAQVRHLPLPRHIVTAGFVNLHGHSAMSLLRGLADDLPLMEWLNQHIWPAEKQHVSEEFVFDGTQLAMAEMIAGGTTTVNDMYFYHEAVARAGLAAGMRTVIGASIMEFATGYALNADDYIKHGLVTRDRFRGEPLLSFMLAPHAPYTVADDTFRKVVTLAEQLEIGIHCHLHETADEITQSIKQYGVRPLERLRQLGVLSPNLIAAHMVHASDSDIELLARYGVHVAHNPVSNLKLASGIARIPALRAAGVNVGIGTDGAASNNSLDMLADTRLAALLAKGISSNPAVMPAAEALHMATMAGACALNLDAHIGSLAVGKQADLIAIDLGGIHTQPIFDPISHLIYAAQRQQVSHSWIAGRLVLDHRHLTTLDADRLAARADWWGKRITQHALEIP